MGSRLDGPEDRMKDYRKKYNKNNKGNAPLFPAQAKGNKVKKAFNQGYKTT